MTVEEKKKRGNPKKNPFSWPYITAETRLSYKLSA
jgi:hypothetical protein